MYQPALTSQATTAAMRTARKLIPANDMVFLLLTRHSGAARRAEPGIHSHDCSESCTVSDYGFRLSLRSAGMTESSFHPAHLADELPFIGGHRLYRQAALFHQHHVFELRLRLDRS